MAIKKFDIKPIYWYNFVSYKNRCFVDLSWDNPPSSNIQQIKYIEMKSSKTNCNIQSNPSNAQAEQTLEKYTSEGIFNGGMEAAGIFLDGTDMSAVASTPKDFGLADLVTMVEEFASCNDSRTDGLKLSVTMFINRMVNHCFADRLLYGNLEEFINNMFSLFCAITFVVSVDKGKIELINSNKYIGSLLTRGNLMKTTFKESFHKNICITHAHHGLPIAAEDNLDNLSVIKGDGFKTIISQMDKTQKSAYSELFQGKSYAKKFENFCLKQVADENNVGGNKPHFDT